MTLRELTDLLESYDLVVTSEGLIKRTGKVSSIAYVQTKGSAYGAVVKEIALRRRAMRLVNVVAAIKGVCKQHNLELRLIGVGTFI